MVSLIDKLLINAKESKYEIHPLVRSFCYERLTQKAIIHKKASQYYINKRTNILNILLEEQIYYHLYEAHEFNILSNFMQEYGNILIDQGQLGFINDYLNKLEAGNHFDLRFNIFRGDISQIKGEWDKSITFFEKANTSTDKKIIVESIIKQGEIYFRQGYSDKSFSYFEKALQISKEESLTFFEARALNDVGLYYLDKDDLNTSLNKLNQSLKMRIELNDIGGIANTYNNIAQVYYAKNKLELALEYFNKSLNIAIENDIKTSEALYLMNIGTVYLKQKDYLSANKYLDLALKKSCAIAYKSYEGGCYGHIAEMYLQQGNAEKALEMNFEALKIEEELGEHKSMHITLYNIGVAHLEKDIKTALHYFLRSLNIVRISKRKKDEQDLTPTIKLIVKKLGKETFLKITQEIVTKLKIDDNFDASEFLNDPKIRNKEKIGRNDPCQCGSGKKFKNCHGVPD